jgi:uncharacterized SAM-binding protein YcdF (DUF218 family)
VTPFAGVSWKKTVGFVLLVLALPAGWWVQWGDWPSPVGERDLEQVDLIVVLGGGAMERPRKTADLYRQGVSPAVLVTGDGNIIYDELLRMGVPANRIAHEKEATSTWENAAFCGRKAIFRASEKVVIVTSWFHGARALSVFQKQYPDKAFLIATEPLKPPLNRWEKQLRRRERYATIFYSIFHRVWPYKPPGSPASAP